jgi:hypothetical protein
MKLYKALPGVSENPLALLSLQNLKNGVGSYKTTGSVADGQQPRGQRGLSHLTTFRCPTQRRSRRRPDEAPPAPKSERNYI